MRNWTGIEIQEEHDRLEREAATILGYMLFEYSRLDMELGLFLVWSDDGLNLHGLTKKLSDDNFYQRLKFLRTAVDAKFSDEPKALEGYEVWLTDVNELRAIRNQLFHGRW